MAEKKIGILAECVCDLPREILKKYDVSIVHFLIKTNQGTFTDTEEITTDNILGYLAAGGPKPTSAAPSPETYQKLFEKKLETYKEVLFISISAAMSDSCMNAKKAAARMGEMGERVHVFDSHHFSTGAGHLVLHAAEAAENGLSIKEILEDLEKLKHRISTTFITENTDFLYHNGQISERTKRICECFHIHPVMTLKDGFPALQFPQFGDYEKACQRYLAKALKNPDNIDPKRAFITHTGCSAKQIENLRRDVASRCIFDELIVTKASATVSCNCGPNTIGILFIKNER